MEITKNANRALIKNSSHHKPPPHNICTRECWHKTIFATICAAHRAAGKDGFVVGWLAGCSHYSFQAAAHASFLVAAYLQNVSYLGAALAWLEKRRRCRLPKVARRSPESGNSGKWNRNLEPQKLYVIVVSKRSNGWVGGCFVLLIYLTLFWPANMNAKFEAL